MSEKVEETKDSIKDDGAKDSESCGQDGQNESQDMEIEVEGRGLFFRVFLTVLPKEIIATHEFHPDFAAEMTAEDHEKVSEILKQPIQEILDVLEQRVKNPKPTS